MISDIRTSNVKYYLPSATPMGWPRLPLGNLATHGNETKGTKMTSVFENDLQSTFNKCKKCCLSDIWYCILNVNHLPFASPMGMLRPPPGHSAMGEIEPKRVEVKPNVLNEAHSILSTCAIFFRLMSSICTSNLREPCLPVVGYHNLCGAALAGKRCISQDMGAFIFSLM